MSNDVYYLDDSARSLLSHFNTERYFILDAASLAQQQYDLSERGLIEPHPKDKPGYRLTAEGAFHLSIPKGQLVRTWANGFGTWHCEVIAHTVGSAAGVLDTARKAIAYEIRRRGNGAETDEFLASEDFRVDYIVDGVKIDGGIRYVFCEGPKIVIWADEDGELPLSDGSMGQPGCDGGEADAVVKVDGQFLCAAEAAARNIIRL